MKVAAKRKLIADLTKAARAEAPYASVSRERVEKVLMPVIEQLERELDTQKAALAIALERVGELVHKQVEWEHDPNNPIDWATIDDELHAILAPGRVPSVQEAQTIMAVQRLLRRVALAMNGGT